MSLQNQKQFNVIIGLVPSRPSESLGIEREKYRLPDLLSKIDPKSTGIQTKGLCTRRILYTLTTRVNRAIESVQKQRLKRIMRVMMRRLHV